jgi:hypothetical protein
MDLFGSYEQYIGKGSLYRLTENFLRFNSVSSNRTACRMTGTGLSDLERISLQLQRPLDLAVRITSTSLFYGDSRGKA